MRDVSHLKKNACVLRVKNTASVSCLVQTQNRTRTLCRLVWNKPVVQPSRGNECVDQRHLCNSHAQPLLPSGGDQEDEPHLPAVAQGSSWCSVPHTLTAAVHHRINTDRHRLCSYLMLTLSLRLPVTHADPPLRARHVSMKMRAILWKLETRCRRLAKVTSSSKFGVY